MTRLSGAVVSLLGLIFSLSAHAASTSITATTPGPTPFISNVTATYAGGTVASISYQISPMKGSFTRPFSASYSAQYLTSTGALQAGSVTIPVFGLYAGFTNTVAITFTFADQSRSVQTINITTASYTDPCAQLDQGTLTQQRVATSDLNFDFFLLKTLCSNDGPTLIDTDGNIRWVGPDGTGRQAIAIYNNAIYVSDFNTGIDRIDLTTLAVTKVGNYAAPPYNVTYTDHHSIDPGRDGLIVDVNTTTQTEAVGLEFNPHTGAVLNYWDLGQIISYTMEKGGDDPSKFVLGTSADWFHNNATAYNPADNTLIVSSRENFVIAVDYDTPLDGQKKIHWILGDTSKAWYQYSSLRAFMLMPTNAATLPPIGQHAVSIDHNKNLLLFDDGFQSSTQVPEGISRTYSAVREYVLNVPAKTVTAGSVYYSPNPTIYNDICGSVYHVNGTYLVDFPTANSRTNVYLQGLNSSEKLVFNLYYPEQSNCNTGWNAYPLASNLFTFTSTFGIAANPTTLPVVAGQSGQIAVTITPERFYRTRLLHRRWTACGGILFLLQPQCKHLDTLSSCAGGYPARELPPYHHGDVGFPYQLCHGQFSHPGAASQWLRRGCQRVQQLQPRHAGHAWRVRQ
jgi:arylsulfate sulfotransferase